MTSTASVISILPGTLQAAEAKAEIASPWFKKAYRRAVVDMHIPDWDEKFLSQVDVGQYVANLKTARAQSIVAYVQSHPAFSTTRRRWASNTRDSKGATSCVMFWTDATRKASPWPCT